jgi:hypothetical protein
MYPFHHFDPNKLADTHSGAINIAISNLETIL